jgi:cob(I)alamin adenosyltransferase
VVGAAELDSRLQDLQRDLFVLGAQMATPPGSTLAATMTPVGPEHCRRLEQWIDDASAGAEPLEHFILPGGCELAARLHVARTCCRRAERAVISLHRHEPLPPDVIVYLNRLGDLLFAWSRQVNRDANCPETQWIPGDR